MKKKTKRSWPMLVLVVGMLLAGAPATAITIQLDYTYDTTSFFGAGNPQGTAAGSQARAALESAAGFFSSILTDPFSAVQTPAPFHSSMFDGVATWQWTMNFDHPTLNTPVELVDPTVAAGDYIIFVGARNIPGSTLGVGGPGGFGWSAMPVGGFTSEEITQINQTTSDFQDAVEARGQSDGFARWGGTIAFDSAPSSPWHYNHSTPTSSGHNDFFSVVIHEMGHALGFGELNLDPNAQTAWDLQVSGSSFIGPAASSAYGGFPPLHDDLAHWAEGVESVVYGTSIVQETAMDPTLTVGTRKRFTELDAAALSDIGWSLAPLPPLIGDYNGNGIVDAADYPLWRDTVGQIVPPGTGADGSGNGIIGPEDYTLWKSNFGITGGAGSSLAAAHAVPEPSSVSLLLLAATVFFSLGRSSAGRRRPCAWSSN